MLFYRKYIKIIIHYKIKCNSDYTGDRLRVKEYIEPNNDCNVYFNLDSDSSSEDSDVNNKIINNENICNNNHSDVNQLRRSEFINNLICMVTGLFPSQLIIVNLNL